MSPSLPSITGCVLWANKGLCPMLKYVTALLTLGVHAQKGYCSWVCPSVCLSVKSHLSPLEHLFALKVLSCTQRATKVQKFVKFSQQLAIFLRKACMHMAPRVHA